MRHFKLLVFLCLLLSVSLGMRQYTIGPSTAATAQFTCPFTDSFPGGAAAPLSASWTRAAGVSSTGISLQQNGSGAIQVSTLSDSAAAIANNVSCPYLSDGQYAQATVAGTPTASGHVSLLVAYNNTTSNGYTVRFSSTSGTMYSIASGSLSSIATGCGGATAGKVLKFTITGTSAPYTLTAYVNGSSVCTTTSSLYAGSNGYPGVRIEDDAIALTDEELSNFSGN